MRLFFSLLILLSFFSRATEPVQVFTDDLGRKVTVPAHPKRIVSLHDLDITIPLIELGVPPVASHGLAIWRGRNPQPIPARSSVTLL